MDLVVVGRHSLLFDDDPMAAFVNSTDALVEWHSLQIDRYDVRHLLSAPPSRRRSHNFESKSPDEFLIDQERYLDLPPDSDQPEVEDDEKPSAQDSYNSVAFSYGNTNDSADQKNADGVIESTGYLPPFAVPGVIAQSLPPTEKVHQIIARTALFVSKHGGQSEIVLRVKQGDNPTFGFLMPDHHLHAYFRYLVEHPELLHTELDETSHGERRIAGSEHGNSNNAGGALSLLGSVYGSGEDEDDMEKVESLEVAVKDEPTSRKPILSNKESIPAVKKNSSITALKPKVLKSSKKDGSSTLCSAMEDKSKNDVIGATSKPPIIEPPLEFKRLIDKLVEFVMRNGRQFEATLLEQDSKHERFPFLLPSNQYHPYYLKALQGAKESKVNGKSYSGRDDLGRPGINKKASAVRGNDLSYTSDLGDVPFESDRKEKFKMVIGKSKKEEHEAEKETQESGVTVDAAAAVAILKAAMRGIKNSDSNNNLNKCPSGNASLASVGGDDSSVANLSEEQRRKVERLKRAKMFVAMLKSGAVPTKAGTSRGSSLEPQESGGLRSGGELNQNNLEREGSLPPAIVNKPVATGSLVEKQTERTSATGFSGEKQTERLLKRKYRSKNGGCGDDSDREDREEDHSRRSRRDDGNDKRRCRSHSSEKNGGESFQEGKGRDCCRSTQEDDGVEGGRKGERDKYHKRTHRSRSRRQKEDDGQGNAVEKERKHRRRHRSSSEESENEEESNILDMEHKRHRGDHDFEEERDKKHRESHSRRHSSRSRRHEAEHEIENAVENEDKSYRKRHSSHSSYDDEKNEVESSENDDDLREDKDHKRFRKNSHSHDSSRRSKKHRSHRSSHHSRDKQHHKKTHSSRDKESRHRHKHDNSSDDEPQQHAALEQSEREAYGELEEGEISSKVSEETNLDEMSSQQRGPSQPSDTTEIPADLRAKIRAMLMATRS